MTNPWRITNGEAQVTVPSGANLVDAIADARPGHVLLVEPRDGAVLNLSGIQKGGYGVTVVFAPDQLVAVQSDDGRAMAGLNFVGGRWSIDEITGNFEQNPHPSLRIGSGSSKISVHGAFMGQSSNIVELGNGNSDVWLNKTVLAYFRRDMITGQQTTRVAFEELKSSQSLMAWRIIYFDDGRAPVYDVGAAALLLAGNENGLWRDTAHNDGYQGRCDPALPGAERFGARDIIIARCDLDINGQGFGNWSNDNAGPGTPGGSGNVWIRAAIEDNLVRSQGDGFAVSGTDLFIARNTIGKSDNWPTIKNTVNANVAWFDPITPNLPHQRHRGGQNVALEGGFWSTTSAAGGGANWTSATINGSDAVVAPERPRIVLPPWFPAVTRPADVAPVEVPALAVRPDVLWHGGPLRQDTNLPITKPVLTVGTWATGDRGQWRSCPRNPPGIEYQWQRDGVPISGATAAIYQAQAADIGTGRLRYGLRIQNANGWSEWAWSAPLDVVA